MKSTKMQVRSLSIMRRESGVGYTFTVMRSYCIDSFASKPERRNVMTVRRNSATTKSRIIQILSRRNGLILKSDSELIREDIPRIPGTFTFVRITIPSMRLVTCTKSQSGARVAARSNESE